MEEQDREISPHFSSANQEKDISTEVRDILADFIDHDDLLGRFPPFFGKLWNGATRPW